jgi:tetratricopeptide (TPR) repeat protein
MSERKSSRRKKLERPVSEDAPKLPVEKIQEEKRQSYPAKTISIQWDALGSRRKVSDAEREEIVDFYYDIQKKPAGQIEKLQKKVEDSPDLLIYQDFLLMAYLLEDMEKEALELANQIFKKNPDTVFGKIAFLESSILQNQLSKIADQFQDKFHYKEAFPEKGIFHIVEVIHYCFAMGKFMALNGETEQANLYMEEIKSIDPENALIKKLQAVLDKSTGVKFYQKIFRRFKRK